MHAVTCVELTHAWLQVWGIAVEFCDTGEITRVHEHAFYVALKYVHAYPRKSRVHELSCRNAEGVLRESKGRVTEAYWRQHVLPALKTLTEALVWAKPKIINWDDRVNGDIGQWNHGKYAQPPTVMAICDVCSNARH